MLKKKIKLTVFFILIIILITIIVKNISLINLQLIYKNWQISLLLVFLAISFILIKSLMLKNVGNLFHIKKNYFHFIKVFCISCFFELTTFTGKFAADGFKYYLWKELPKKNRFKLLLFLRTADVCGFIWIFIFLLLPLKLAILTIILFLIFIYFNLKKDKINYFPDSFRKTLKDHWLKWLTISILSAIAYSIMITQLSLVFNILNLAINKSIITIFLLSHGLGVLSQLPFGLGVKDFSIFYQLKNFLSQSEIILGLIWVRICGELISVLLGVMFLLKYFKKK